MADSKKETVSLATKARVERQFQGKTEGTDVNLDIHTFVTEPAKVFMDLAVTINLGNYESAKISVGISVPCYKEEVDAAYDYAKNWISDRLQQEVAEVNASKSKQGKASNTAF